MLSNIDNYIYSKKFNHIYLYGDINNNTIKEITNSINELNKRELINGVYLKPNAIVLHINSPGGSLFSGMALIDTFEKSSIPIITFVEGMAASAASMILLASKYRIIAPHSTILIHQFSTYQSGKYEELKFESTINDKLMNIMEKFYLSKTKIPKNKLKELLSRDIYLNASECLQYGLVDKVLKKTKKDFHQKYFTINPEYVLKTSNLIKKTNFNNLYFYGKSNENNSCYHQRKTLGLQYILSFDDNNKNKTLKNIGSPKPILIHINEASDTKDIYELLPIINTISVAKLPIYSIIKSPTTQNSLLYSVLCYKRFITENSIVMIDFISLFDFSKKHENTIVNVSYMRNIIKNIFIEYTKLPKNIINNLFTKRFSFSAKECVKYGICDEII